MAHTSPISACKPLWPHTSLRPVYQNTASPTLEVNDRGVDTRNRGAGDCMWNTTWCYWLRLYTAIPKSAYIMCARYSILSYTHIIFGPILDDRLKEHSWNPERVSSVFTFVCVCVSVCLCVCTRATEHTFWPRNLIFGLSDHLDMRRKKTSTIFDLGT